jgi:hypothetical protein|tara:strand:+ start:143 stop:409 length:267 start_codon:yes stop_codon:yes gene_type:complete
MINREYKKTVGQKLFHALMKKYEWQIVDAKARMSIYFTSSVGIGEHPQHTEEMDKLLDTISTAEDKKSALERHFSDGSWEMPFFEDNK